MSKRKRRKAVAAVQGQQLNPQMFGHYDVERGGTRKVTFWPGFDPQQELSRYDLEVIWKVGRSLFTNFGEVAMLVKTMVHCTGVLMPLPMTLDREWNALARRAFLRRVMSPALFDRAGKKNWVTAQLWIEKWAVIDGDCLTVLTKSGGGNAQFAFYRAPQVDDPKGRKGSGWVDGVQRDIGGSAVAYNVRSYTGGDDAVVPARAAILYSHDAEVEGARHASEIVAAMTDSRFIWEVKGLTKSALKVAASMAVVETVQAGAGGQAAMVQAMKTARGEADAAPPPPPLVVDGSKVVQLDAGHKLELLHDNRPSSEARAFNKDLVRSLAYAVGLDPEVVFYVADMGGPSARFSLGKLKEWRELRAADREVWCNAVYRYVLADEMKHGRLRRCRDRNWLDVQWVNLPDKTIDRGREAAAIINLVREGLADPDAFLLATEGITFTDLVERRAHAMQEAEEIAAAHGCTLAQLFPGALGGNASAEPAAEPSSGAGVHAGGLDSVPEPEPGSEGGMGES